MKVLKKCLQFTLFFYCVTAFAQEFELPENKLIKSSKEDSTILAEVKVVEEQIKIDDEKKYHWYRNAIVNNNIRGYHGQLLNGEYKILDLNNKLLILGRFKLGLKVGQWKYWDNDGNYIRIENWKKGLLHGIVRKFYSNGVIKEELNYRKGSKNGRFVKYNEEGQIIEMGKYKNGKLDGKLHYFSDGEKTNSVKFKAGEVYETKGIFNWLKNNKKEEKKEEGEVKMKNQDTDEHNSRSFFERIFKNKKEEEEKINE